LGKIRADRKGGEGTGNESQFADGVHEIILPMADERPT
jgi:hypothetical protein